MTIPYPNRVVKVGDTDSALVKTIQTQLNDRGCGPLKITGVFDDTTLDAVKLFQGRFADVTGQPLIVDGKIGSLTWGALFGAATVPSQSTGPSRLAKEVIKFAKTQLGVMEQPLGSNRGPEVDKYQRSVGLHLSPGKPGYYWCVAFTYFCYNEAAKKLGISNPHIKTAGVLDHWNKAGGNSKIVRLSRAKAVSNPGLITPGSLFILETGGGGGHTGIVVEVKDGRLVTIEGNTNAGGSANGIGVFKREARKIVSISKGFIDYSAF